MKTNEVAPVNMAKFDELYLVGYPIAFGESSRSDSAKVNDIEILAKISVRLCPTAFLILRLRLQRGPG